MSNNNLTVPTANSSGIDGAYQALARAEHNSPEHHAAVEAIQSYERATAKAQENTLKGSGISGHASGRYAIVPKGAVEGYELKSPHMLSGGNSQSSPDLRTDIVKIGDFTTSIAVGEAMRRDMSPAEWFQLTGRDYTSLTMTDRGATPATPAQRRPVDPRLQALDDALNAQTQLDKMLSDEAAGSDEAKAVDAMSFDPSLAEQVMSQHLGPDVTEGITKQVVDTGEFNAETMAQYGITGEMYQDAVEHYTAAAENMLATVNSSVNYVTDFLSEPEQVKARQAVVSRDMATVTRLGEIARDRAAAMSFKEVSEYLTKDEKAMIRLRSVNGTPVVDVNGATTSWGSALMSGLISFNGKK